MKSTYRDWLTESGREQSNVSTLISDAKRVERHYGDLDELYDEDELTEVLNSLQYSKDDERRNRPNPSRLDIDGNVYKTLPGYKTAVKRYREFREATRESSRNPWDDYLREASRRFEDGTLDRAEGYKEELVRAVSQARTAVLADSDDWPKLLKDAITHRKNNLINRRSYAEGRDSNQTKIERWIDGNPDEVRGALAEMWDEVDGTPADRIRAFDELLPADVLGREARSARMDVTSYLMMGLDPDLFPPCRLTKFHDTYKSLDYPTPRANDLGSEYEHALQFLDVLQTEARRRGMARPDTRPDAQSVVWSLSDWLTSRIDVDNAKTRPDSDSPMPTPGQQRSGRGLNTILYGPPGTGKTYTTIEQCVEICDGEIPEDREELRARYGVLMDEERVEFVTFHQSYGYEEFVEGLRPVAADDGGMRLVVVDGVLKRIAERARKLPGIGVRRIFKMSLGDPKSWGGSARDSAVFAECIDDDCVLLEYGGDIDWSEPRYDDWKEIRERWRADRNPDATAHDTDIQAMWRFRTEMRPSDIVVASDGYRRFRGVGEITGGYEFQRREDGFHHRRAVRWHWHVRERDGDPVSVFKEGSFQWRPVNQMTPANPAGLRPYLNEVDDIGGTRPHVLVIDEINRANISKVMGELITLLEEDKREGAENELTVTLPYSGNRFTLPANLYVLGTMNTADRSIAVLDTALRRRFLFEEMSPDVGLLRDAADRTDVDLPRVLQAMNERLEYLVDRDHLIGHAWFMDAETREDVDTVMRRKLIPLIAEYFYDDWSKVQSVLGGRDDFVERQRLDSPPGLSSDAGEDRYRWTVRTEFSDDAYEKLIASESRYESGE